MSDTEYVDFHAVVQPKGWKPGDPCRMESEVLHVFDGPDSLKRAVGKLRNVKVWRQDTKGNDVPAFPAMKDAATDTMVPLEVKGRAELTTNAQSQPVTYLTAQKARPWDGTLPEGAALPAPVVGGSGTSSGSGYSGQSPEDRRRIVACWAIKQAAITVAHQQGTMRAGDPHLSTTDRDAVWDWASWFAASAYRLGAMIEAKEGDWTAPSEGQQTPQDRPDAAPRPSVDEGGF